MKLPEECRPFYELMQMAKLVARGIDGEVTFRDLIRRSDQGADGYPCAGKAVRRAGGLSTQLFRAGALQL